MQFAGKAQLAEQGIPESVTRAGTFTNKKGLQLQFYAWDVPEPKGVLIFAHGHGVHACFEMMHSHTPGGPRTKYEGSWPEAFNQKGISVFTMDHQGHGRSQYARGLRCYFDRVDYLVDDFTQFTKLVRQELGQETPLFIAGMSMGGYVVVESAIRDEQLANGCITLCPMLSLNALSKKGVNRLLLPFVTWLSNFIPTVPIAATPFNRRFPHSQLELENDPLTWPSGVRKTRARVAAEYWLCTNRIQTRMHAMRMPFITFHGRNDVFVDPESSQLLYDKAGAEDKEVYWVEDVFHDLIHEQPSCGVVTESATQWITQRIEAMT